MKFDASRLHAALAANAAAMKKTKRQVVTQAAKSFVKDIVSITPPANSGARGSAAKKQGEAAVTKDYARAFKPFDDRFAKALFYLSGRAWRTGSERHHTEATDREQRWLSQILGYVSAGRDSAIQKIFRDMGVKRTWLPKVTKKQADSFRGVNTGRMRAGALFVTPPGAIAAALKTATAHVGTLAAGWDPAAAALGLKLPAWIRRHHTPGSATASETPSRFTLTVENAARYIGHIADYDRRMDWAMSIQAPRLERQTAHALRANLKKSGWH